MKNEKKKPTWVFIFQKYGKLWSILRELFVEHKPHFLLDFSQGVCYHDQNSNWSILVSSSIPKSNCILSVVLLKGEKKILKSRLFVVTASSQLHNFLKRQECWAVKCQGWIISSSRIILGYEWKKNTTTSKHKLIIFLFFRMMWIVNSSKNSNVQGVPYGYGWF